MFRPMSGYEMGELEPSACQDLDTNGMQPHAREYLERQMTSMYSEECFEQVEHEVIHHHRGIQFSGKP